MSNQNKIRGNTGEDLASEFLIQKGYKIIKRNFHSRFGEIDIIATYKDSLVFVEVKARSSSRFGAPIEAVTPQKIENIRKTGEYFLIENKNLPQKLTIEVVSVDLSDTFPHLTVTSVF